MAKNLLRHALVDPVANAEGLPGLAEGMEMQDPTKTVLPFDACPLQISTKHFVGWERRKDGIGARSRPTTLAQIAELNGENGAHRDGSLVLGCALSKQRRRAIEREIQIIPHQCGNLLLALTGVEKGLIDQRPRANRSEQEAQLVFCERTIRTDLLPANVQVLELPDWITPQALHLHQPV